MKNKDQITFKNRAGTGACPYGAIIFLFIFVLLSGCSEDDPDTSARFNLNTPAFPEIQEMLAKTAITLEIAGKTCTLTLETSGNEKWKTKGSCPGIPIGTHNFTLNYRHTDWDITLASASGSAELTPQKTTSLPPLILEKNMDDDGDQHTNLSEAMFGSDPLNANAKPPMPPFEKTISYFSTGDAPNALTLGLLNTDTIPDVIITNGASDTVTVRLGQSDGTLQAAIHYPSGPDIGEKLIPIDPVVTQLNGDNALDILLVNTREGGSGPGSLGVLLGNGDGSFQTAQTYAVGTYPVAVASGDLNRDGFTDAVTGHFISKDLAVLLGKGDGTFQDAVFYATGPLGDVTALTLGDLNGDGDLDIVASVKSGQNVFVFLGNGDGTLQNPSAISVGIMISLGLADLNADTRLDLIAVIEDDIIAILMGNGDGTFQTPAFFKAGKNPGSLAIRDMDGDNNIDLLTENEADGIVALLMGNGDGTFKSPVFFETGTSPSWIALGDINQDGAFDLFFPDRNSDRVGILLSR